MELFLTKNELIQENKSISKIFETNIKKKRGRKTKESYKNVNVHDKTSFVNLLRKIQVHFLTFLINISNDVLSTIPNYKKKGKNFKKLDYTIKKRIDYEFFNTIKNSTLKDIYT